MSGAEEAERHKGWNKESDKSIIETRTHTKSALAAITLFNAFLIQLRLRQKQQRN